MGGSANGPIPRGLQAFARFGAYAKEGPRYSGIRQATYASTALICAIFSDWDSFSRGYFHRKWFLLIASRKNSNVNS